VSRARGPAQRRPSRLDLDRRPILVFWETTRACLLACRHCRAEALASGLDVMTKRSISGLEAAGTASTLAAISG
jgi:MoaA/NifB/PqqE/SkfB family radical SAM enzyme